MKLKFRIERFKWAKMVIFAQWCGGKLAHHHARSGEPPLISSYLGEADTFDQAIAALALNLCRSGRARLRKLYEGCAPAGKNGSPTG